MTTKTNPLAAHDLFGKTAKDLRSMITAGTVSNEDVVKFLKAREKANKLRFPSRQLLSELSGEPMPKTSGKTRRQITAPQRKVTKAKGKVVAAKAKTDPESVTESEWADLAAAIAAYVK